MGFEHHLNPDLNFVFTRVQGEISDDLLRQHVKDLNRDAAGLRGARELVQVCSEVDMAPITVKATYDAAQLESKQPRSIGGKLAICVTSVAHFGMARVYSSGAGATRAETHVGYELSEALRWLADSDADYAAMRDYVQDRCPDEQLA